MGEDVETQFQSRAAASSRLARERLPEILDGVKCRLLLLLCCLLASAGCQRYVTSGDRFRKVVSTDYQGNVVSEWTAVGHIRKIEGGVTFLAVAKEKPEPFPYQADYVIGRRVRVIAPNISIYRTSAPAWIVGEQFRIVEQTLVAAPGK